MSLLGSFAIPPGYGLAIKAGLLAVLFVAGLGVGCHWQKGADQSHYDKMVKEKDKAIGEKNAALHAAQDQLDSDANVLIRIGNLATVEINKAAEQQRLGAQAVAQAKADRQAYLQRISDNDRAREKAKTDSPACRKQLEAPLCAALH